MNNCFYHISEFVTALDRMKKIKQDGNEKRGGDISDKDFRSLVQIRSMIL